MSSGSSEIIMLKYSYWETKDIPELVSSAAAAFTAPACAGTPPALCQRLSGPTQADMLASIINQSHGPRGHGCLLCLSMTIVHAAKPSQVCEAIVCIKISIQLVILEGRIQRSGFGPIAG